MILTECTSSWYYLEKNVLINGGLYARRHIIDKNGLTKSQTKVHVFVLWFQRQVYVGGASVIVVMTIYLRLTSVSCFAPWPLCCFAFPYVFRSRSQPMPLLTEHYCLVVAEIAAVK